MGEKGLRGTEKRVVFGWVNVRGCVRSSGTVPVLPGTLANFGRGKASGTGQAWRDGDCPFLPELLAHPQRGADRSGKVLYVAGLGQLCPCDGKHKPDVIPSVRQREGACEERGLVHFQVESSGCHGVYVSATKTSSGQRHDTRRQNEVA